MNKIRKILDETRSRKAAELAELTKALADGAAHANLLVGRRAELELDLVAIDNHLSELDSPK